MMLGELRRSQRAVVVPLVRAGLVCSCAEAVVPSVPRAVDESGSDGRSCEGVVDPPSPPTEAAPPTVIALSSAMALDAPEWRRVSNHQTSVIDPLAIASKRDATIVTSTSAGGTISP